MQVLYSTEVPRSLLSVYTADLQTYAAEARQLRLGAMAPPSDAGDLVAVTYYDYADPDVASAVKSGITARQPVYSAIDALVQSATVVFEQVESALQAVEQLNDRDNWRAGLRVSLSNGMDVPAARRALCKLNDGGDARASSQEADCAESVTEQPPTRARGEICQLREGKFGFIRKARKGKRRPASSENLFFTMDRVVEGDATVLRVGDVVEYEAYTNDDGKPNARSIVRVAKPEDDLEAEVAALVPDAPPPPPRPRLALKARTAGAARATSEGSVVHGSVAKGPDGTSGFPAGWRTAARTPCRAELSAADAEGEKAMEETECIRLATPA